MPDSRGVVYLLLGDTHAAHLAVSLCSLRDAGYAGPVTVLCDKEGCGAVGYMLASNPPAGELLAKRIGEVSASTRKLQKCLVPEHSPYEQTVFLDCDTLVLPDERYDPCPIHDIFPMEHELVVTNFAGWNTQRNRMRRRIMEWEAYEPHRVKVALSRPDLLINTAVLGFSKHNLVLPEWRRVAWQRANEQTNPHIRRAGGKYLQTDEMALQLIYREFPHSIWPWQYNASVVFDASRPAGELAQVKIWHGHGWKFFKRESGRAIYLPWYLKYLRDDCCGLRDLPLPAKCVRCLLHCLPSDVRAQCEKLWRWR